MTALTASSMMARVILGLGINRPLRPPDPGRPVRAYAYWSAATGMDALAPRLATPGIRDTEALLSPRLRCRSGRSLRGAFGDRDRRRQGRVWNPVPELHGHPAQQGQHEPPRGFRVVLLPGLQIAKRLVDGAVPF